MSLITHQKQLPPNWIKARQHTTTYDKFSHEECYEHKRIEDRRRSLVGKGEWSTLMVDDYMKDKYCAFCSSPLQCKNHRFKVTLPGEEICSGCKEEEPDSKGVQRDKA